MTPPSKAALALLLAAAIPLGAGACTMQRRTYGRPVSASQFELIEPRKTTKNQVLAILGAPDLMEQRVGGSVFLYRFRFQRSDETKLSLFQASASYSEAIQGEQRIEIYFDRKGIVRDLAVLMME